MLTTFSYSYKAGQGGWLPIKSMLTYNFLGELPPSLCILKKKLAFNSEHMQVYGGGNFFNCWKIQILKYLLHSYDLTINTQTKVQVGCQLPTGELQQKNNQQVNYFI